jgi:hypothetical protein
MLQAGRSRVRVLRGEILNLLNPSDRTRPWGLLSLLTEMSTENIKKNNVFGK